MSTNTQALIGIGGAYVAGIVLLIAIFGFARKDNKEFQPQKRVQARPWINLPGSFDINKAVIT
jgi:hypothetical protein